MHVAQILREKGRSVEVVPIDVTLMEVTHLLNAKKIGAIVVFGADNGIAGIVSERDIVRMIGECGPDALRLSVGDAMTKHVLTCREHDSVDQIMALMTTRRIRHLPVVEAGKLVGIISIGDVVKHRVAEVEFEAMAMRDYIAAA